MNDNINNIPPQNDPLLQDITHLTETDSTEKPAKKVNKVDHFMKIAMVIGVVLLTVLVGLWWWLQQQSPSSTDTTDVIPPATSGLIAKPEIEHPMTAAPASVATTPNAPPAAEANAAAPSQTADDIPQQIPKSIKINPIEKVDPNQLPTDPALLKEVHDKEQAQQHQMVEQQQILEKQLQTSNNIVKLKADQIAELEKQLQLLEKQGK